MNVVIINKSDSTGGAAIVSRRLMEALRAQNVDAHMLVVEKLSDSPYITKVSSRLAVAESFLSERLKIFIANGFNKDTLFKIDTASDGLPLWNHPLVKEADAILLNWVNQGMLSLNGIKKIIALGKPVIWTMHDMWCMTGICHHAGKCTHFTKQCGDCHLLGKRAAPNDLSFKIWHKKKDLYDFCQIYRPYKFRLAFVAVSNWLANKCRVSSLLDKADISVIPNAFNLIEYNSKRKELKKDKRIRILFGAARIDDPIKGLPMLGEMSRILAKDSNVASRLDIVTFGNIKNPESMPDFGIPHTHIGVVKGEDNLRKIYDDSDIVVSASSYETLPGTLVEAQAYGCIPVSFNQGGQADIISHLATGYLADYSNDLHEGGKRLANGVKWAVEILSNDDMNEKIRERMFNNVVEKFSYTSVARKYINLIERLRHK